MTNPADKPVCECGETMLDGSYCGYYCPKGCVRTVTDNADKLLPCPFCGGEAELSEPSTSECYASVRCPNHSCNDQPYPGVSQAIAAWNTRANLTPVNRELLGAQYEQEYKNFMVTEDVLFNMPDALEENKKAAYQIVYRALDRMKNAALANASTSPPAGDAVLMEIFQTDPTPFVFQIIDKVQRRANSSGVDLDFEDIVRLTVKECATLGKPQDAADKKSMALFLEMMGFECTMDNGDHVVTGHGFSKRHTSLACVIKHIGDHLFDIAPTPPNMVLPDAPRDGTRVRAFRNNVEHIVWFEKNLNQFLTMDDDWNLIPLGELEEFSHWLLMVSAAVKPDNGGDIAS